MFSKIIYLDYAAGTPIFNDCLKASLKVSCDYFYNPSAIYKGASLVADLLTEYRRRIALVLSTKPDNLMFTFGASQANFLLISALKYTYPGSKIACLNIDHSSVRDYCDEFLNVDSQTGRILLEDLLNLDKDICCLSIAGINNELGVIQNFKLIKNTLIKLRKKRLESGNSLPILLHIDASQMALVYSLKPQALAEADFVTYNGAKFYAFKQTGLLYIKNLNTLKYNFIEGDFNNSPQLNNQSLMLISGLMTALEMVDCKRFSQTQRLKDLQSFFEAGLAKLSAEIVIGSKYRSPHITMSILPKIDNETLALKLSQKNIFVGIGSACHSQTDLWQTSALKFLNYSRDEIYRSIRFSFGYETTKTQLKIVLRELGKILNV